MTLPECKSWALDRYIVRQSLRPDNPLFPRFIIMRGDKVVGYSFSMPDADQCASIERFAKLGRYVLDSAPLKRHTYRLPRHR